MKKVFLMAYARKNFGDDLFLKMLIERYPMHEFYMKISNCEFLSYLDEKYTNLHVIEGPDTDDEIYKTDVNDYDAYIYIGGSIFMEGGKVYNLSEKFYNFIERCKKNNKPFCYVSCNYGPYKTKEYLELSRKTFKTCTDICFRDLYSYNMFDDIPNVRYAPDFAFSYPVKNISKIKDSVGISVIDLGIRNELKEKEKDYINFLTNNIKSYLSQGKKVYLYSFCKHEGDEKTIDILLDKIGDSQNITAVRFDGDIDKFLDMYSSMEYMVCARFHAMILSLISRQKLYVMSYSKKIDNVIQDLQINIPVLHFNEINESLNIDLDNFVAVDNESVNSIIDKSSKQDWKIREILN